MTEGAVVPWVGHLVLAAAVAVMGWNVAAYSLLFKGQVIRTDFFYFLTALVAVCFVYALVFLIGGAGYSFQQLQLFMLVLITTILAYALVDLGRRGLDWLFFTSEVRRVRDVVATAGKDAGLTHDVTTVIQGVQSELAEVSTEHVVRLTEQALRRLNNPDGLAKCDLVRLLPCTLGLAGTRNGADTAKPTPLETYQALRKTLIAAIERLKPADGDHGIGSAAGLHYNILCEEYLQGLLNKNIMIRHSISEGTFHRNRRQAISTIARELQAREARLAVAARVSA
jgi:hypothetical protein